MASQSIKKTKETIISKVWLHYYNQVLFDKGLITERERNLMAIKIEGWSGSKK